MNESQNGCLKKTKHAKFFEKRLFLTPLLLTKRKISHYPYGKPIQPNKTDSVF